jgi:hypothetical protein
VVRPVRVGPRWCVVQETGVCAAGVVSACGSNENLVCDGDVLESRIGALNAAAWFQGSSQQH